MPVLKLIATTLFALLRHPAWLVQISLWVAGAGGALIAHSLWPLLVGAGGAFLFRGVIGDARE